MSENQDLLRSAPADRGRLARAALVDAALAMLREGPVDELNVAEVCRRAGVSRPTFYRHFESPTELARVAMLAKLESSMAAHLPPAPQPDWVPAARGVIHQLLSELHDDAPLYLNALRGSLGLRLVADAIDFLDERLLRQSPLAPVLQSGGRGLSAGDLARFLSGGGAWHILHWLSSDFTGRNSVDEETDRLLALMVGATSALAGVGGEAGNDETPTDGRGSRGGDGGI